MFWIRRDNLDIDSAWWNYENETGLNFRRDDKVSPANNDYWIRDYNDPDIDRIPDEEDPEFKLLSERPEVEQVLRDANNNLRAAVPYELVYPEWFKLHPEFILVRDTLKDFNLDIQENVLRNIRDSDDNRKVDHLIIGFFQGLLPQSNGEAEYLFKFFRELFKDKAFVNILPKSTSPCVTYATDPEGFYGKRLVAESDPFLGSIVSATNLADLKNKSYYYEYSAKTDSSVNLNNLFRFVDPLGKVRIDLEAKDIIIRKVVGSLPRGKVIDVTVGKGSLLPEFTYFGEVPYPVDPNQTNIPSTPELLAWNTEILDDHIRLFGGIQNIFGENWAERPQTYIAIRMQKSRLTRFDSWDNGATTIPGTTPYYEEIIIVDPRMEYRGTYSEDFKTPSPFLIFYDYEYPKIFDDPDIFIYGSGEFIKYENFGYAGTRFQGKKEEADALAIPVLENVLSTMIFKTKEETLAKSFCLFVISIQVTEVEWYESEEFFQLLQIGFFIANLFTAGAFTSVQAFIEAVLVTAILTLAAGAIASELIELLVEEFGFEVAGIIAAIVTIIAVYFRIKLPTDVSKQTELALQVASNFTDSYVDISNADIQLQNEQFKEESEKRFADYEELKEEVDALMGADPNISATTFIFSPPEETPSEFFNRVIGNLNPGADLYKIIESEVTRFKRITHTGLPEIAIDEPTLLDRLDILK
jgi:hypothetical protein